MKKLWIGLAFAVCLLLILSVAVAGCGDKEGDDALIGIWTDPAGIIELEFKSDGSMVLRGMGEEETSTFTAKDGKLAAPNAETGAIEEVTYKIEGDKLLFGEDGVEGIFTKKK